MLYRRSHGEAAVIGLDPAENVVASVAPHRVNNRTTPEEEQRRWCLQSLAKGGDF